MQPPACGRYTRTRSQIAKTALVAALAIAGPVMWLGTQPARAAASTGCSLYASNTGSDSNTGTQSAPFQTLKKLASSLAAGQTGCLQSGQTFDTRNLSFDGGETHGTEAAPVTITSTNQAEPATISHSIALNYGVNYLIFTHLNFVWSMPKPWDCWNSEGNLMPNEVITGPGTCAPGTPYPESAVQIALGGKGDEFTYDEITSDDSTICLNLGGGSSGWGEDNVIENDRIHNCGPTVEAQSTGFAVVNEEMGWHAHGIYDYARKTVIKNNYIYENSRNGILFYGGGEGAVAEHNIIDRNGAGVWFGNNKNNYVAWNIITNSNSPRGTADYGIGSSYPGTGDVATKNCLYGNESGEVEAGEYTATENKTNTNPLYTNGASHEYTLQSGSPCVGYGPESAQPKPSKSEAPVESPAKTQPVETPPVETTPVETPKTTTPVETPPVETPKTTPPAETPKTTPPVETPKTTPPAEKAKTTQPVTPPARKRYWGYWGGRATIALAGHSPAVKSRRRAHKAKRASARRHKK